MFRIIQVSSTFKEKTGIFYIYLNDISHQQIIHFFESDLTRASWLCFSNYKVGYLVNICKPSVGIGANAIVVCDCLNFTDSVNCCLILLFLCLSLLLFELHFLCTWVLQEMSLCVWRALLSVVLSHEWMNNYTFNPWTFGWCIPVVVFLRVHLVQLLCQRLYTWSTDGAKSWYSCRLHAFVR